MSITLSYYERKEKEATVTNYTDINCFFDSVKEKELSSNIVLDYHRVLTAFGKTFDEKLENLIKLSQMGFKITICSFVTNNIYFDTVDDLIKRIFSNDIKHQINLDGIVYQCKKDYNYANMIKFKITNAFGANYLIDDHILNLNAGNGVVPILFNCKFFPITLPFHKYSKYLANSKKKYREEIIKQRERFQDINKSIIMIKTVDQLISFLRRDKIGHGRYKKDVIVVNTGS